MFFEIPGEILSSFIIRLPHTFFCVFSPSRLLTNVETFCLFNLTS